MDTGKINSVNTVIISNNGNISNQVQAIAHSVSDVVVEKKKNQVQSINVVYSDIPAKIKLFMYY